MPTHQILSSDIPGIPRKLSRPAGAGNTPLYIVSKSVRERIHENFTDGILPPHKAGLHLPL